MLKKATFLERWLFYFLYLRLPDHYYQKNQGVIQDLKK